MISKNTAKVSKAKNLISEKDAGTNRGNMFKLLVEWPESLPIEAESSGKAIGGGFKLLSSS